MWIKRIPKTFRLTVDTRFSLIVTTSSGIPYSELVIPSRRYQKYYRLYEILQSLYSLDVNHTYFSKILITYK